jgi:hypothetical protein
MVAAVKKKIRWNVLIGILFLLVNGVAFSGALMSALQPPHTVEPIKDAEVDQLLTYISSGKHSGESWQVTMSDLEAEQTMTWYLKKYPQIPFASPQVHIKPDSVAGEGDVILAGLRIHVGAKVNVTLKDGLPVVKIISLTLPFPKSVQDQVEQEIQHQLGRAALLPVRFTSADWGDGVVVVKGTIR